MNNLLSHNVGLVTAQKNIKMIARKARISATTYYPSGQSVSEKVLEEAFEKDGIIIKNKFRNNVPNYSMFGMIYYLLADNNGNEVDFTVEI